MATLTAHFLIGENDPHHLGVIPRAQLSLFENDRPVFVLSSLMTDDKAKSFSWVPTLEHMLDDAILMIAVHFLRAFSLKDIAKKNYRSREEKPFEVYEDMDPRTHEDLIVATRRLPSFPKLVITVLEGSSLREHVASIKKYSMDVELCFAGYKRNLSEWTQGTHIEDFIDFLNQKSS
jgi:hypothetical protein